MEPCLQIDLECFGFDRFGFMQKWLLQPNARVFTCKHVNEVQGFVVMRKALNGWKIGPLFAENSTDAEGLYLSCLNSAPGEDIFIDVPVPNAGGISMVK